MKPLTSLRCVVVGISFSLLGFAGPQALWAQRSDDSLAIPATDEGLAGIGPIRRADWFRNLWNERRNLWATRTHG
jgi:hypothetical protein